MIYCAWLVWNDEHLIRKSIRSVKKHVDHFILIDGAFLSNLKALSSGEHKSTDRTYDVVKSEIPNDKLTWIESTDFWRDEAHKRTEYCKVFLSLAKKGDWLLWLDGDEICVNNLHGGFDYLSNKSDYVPHWVWVKSIYPIESPSHPLNGKWRGKYKDKYDYVTETYFDMGKRINILPYIEGLHYKTHLQPFSSTNALIPRQVYTMKYFMIWNLVWMRRSERLLLRLERSIMERRPKAGKWRDSKWSSNILDNMEKKYNIKLDI